MHGTDAAPRGREVLTRRQTLFRLALGVVGAGVFGQLSIATKAYAQPARLRFASSSGGAAIGNGLTPTHYVAPFASVSGATSDNDVQTAGAFTSASNSATPCTFKCALVNASGANIVQLAPGVYLGDRSLGDNTTACFTSSNSGTSAVAPLVFVAQYPAAINRGNTSLFSEVRRLPADRLHFLTTADPNISPWPPLLGGGGIGSFKSHVIWDGFYTDENPSPPSSNGLFMARGSGPSGNGINIQFRRCYFQRYDWLANHGINLGGNNYDCIQLHTCTDPKVLDCYFTGGYDSAGSHNQACIAQYAAENYTIQNNTFDGVICAMYIKGTGARDPYGLIKLNRMINCKHNLRLLANSTTQDCTMTQNLIYSSSAPPSGWAEHAYFDVTSAMQRWVFTNNTFILRSTGAGLYLNRQNGTNTFRDNIVAHISGTINTGVDGWYINSQVSMAAFGTLNYNVYWSHNGGNQWNSTAGARTTIETWRTDTGAEANSTTAINPTFADSVDFRISGSATTASSTGGPVGYSITGSEEAGVRANPSY